MGDADLLARVCETLEDYLALGNDSTDLAVARFVSNPEVPRVYDANHVSRVRAAEPAEIEGVLAEAERLFGDLGFRQVHCDPFTPAAFEARLALEGYHAGTELDLVLEGELTARGDGAEIRQVQDDADWVAVLRLTRLDHEGVARKEGRAAYSAEVTRQLALTSQLKGPALRYWIARADGQDCAYFSSWPGENGVGKVEDLFTHPDFRHRGIATALIAHAVDDARERGAGPIVIGAATNDTPRLMYAALGFRPLCVTRTYLWRAGEGA